MRRMIPQKLIDFINKIKNKFSFDADGKGVFASDLQVAGDIQGDSDIKCEGDLIVNDDATFNGNVSIAGTINGEGSPSFKPIYCHPIYFDYVGTGDYTGRHYYFTCLIFNNNSTPFTLSSFVNYVTDLCINYNAKIMCSGSSKAPTSTIINNCIQRVPNQNYVGLYGLDVSTGNINYFSLSTAASEDTNFEDGVNKIN